MTTLYHLSDSDSDSDLDVDKLPASRARLLFNRLWCAHLSPTHVTVELGKCPHTTSKTNSPTVLGRPHLPPIWPLEQTRWVRGWVAHRSLRKVEVLVVTAESLGLFGQPEGAHRPRGGWPCPKRGNFSRTRLRLSHSGFQMKRLFKSRKPS